MALLLRESPVRERAGDLADALEPLRLGWPRTAAPTRTGLGRSAVSVWWWRTLDMYAVRACLSEGLPIFEEPGVGEGRCIFCGDIFAALKSG
eukprot:scaffold90158_cov29-Phaeocystis_antarctica.AAC.2